VIWIGILVYLALLIWASHWLINREDSKPSHWWVEVITWWLIVHECVLGCAIVIGLIYGGLTSHHYNPHGPGSWSHF